MYLLGVQEVAKACLLCFPGCSFSMFFSGSFHSLHLLHNAKVFVLQTGVFSSILPLRMQV